MKRIVWSALASLLLAVPLAASAADGYVTGNVNMRAGPDVEYPEVTVLPYGTQVSIRGCTTGWEWCDVIADGNRGWVAGNFIQYEYNNQPVLMPAYGARIGIPIVTFVIGSYWGAHYHNRPFYRQRARWYSRPIRQRPPPRPLNRPLRPIRPRPVTIRPRPVAVHARPITVRPKPATVRPKPAAVHPKPTGTRPQPRPQPTGARPQLHPQPGARPVNTPAQGVRPVTRPAPNNTKPAPKKKPKGQNGEQ